MRDRIQRILKSVFTSQNGDFPDEWGPEDIEEWDSMNHLNMIMNLSEEFGVMFEFEEVMAIEKIGDIQRILKEKGIH